MALRNIDLDVPEPVSYIMRFVPKTSGHYCLKVCKANFANNAFALVRSVISSCYCSLSSPPLKHLIF